MVEANSVIFFLLLTTFVRFEGSFGRRASDGGANLRIYYPASNSFSQPVESMYSHPNSRECLRMGMESANKAEVSGSLECGADESSDEIQR